jgi:hypothetical protein
LTILQIKVAHTIIFWILSCSVLYALYSAVFDRIDAWTGVAVSLVLVESVVLIAAGWKCPLTTLAESLGASDGSVVDIFLPKWFADRIFPVCGTTFLIASVLLVMRLLRS